MLNFFNIFEIEVMTDLIQQIIQTGNKGLKYIFQFFLALSQIVSRQLWLISSRQLWEVSISIS